MFKDRLTQEEGDKIYQLLIGMVESGNLQALDRLLTIFGDSSGTQVNVDASIGGGVIMMEQQSDGDA